MIATLARSRLHYAWIVVAVTFLVMLLTAGIRSVPGVLILPLEEEFGWTRATVSLAVSINLFVYGMCGPFAASIMERFGMRRLMAGALVVLTLAILMTTQLTKPWQLNLLWGMIVGLGTGAMAGWIAAAVSNRWFMTRRGVVVGLLTASNATGQLVFVPLLASLVVAYGWRSAVLLVAGVALLLIPLVATFIRNFPRDLGLRAYGATPSDEDPRPRVITGNPFSGALQTLTQSLRSRHFLLLAGTFFICGLTTSGLIGTHLIPFARECGLSEVTAASLLAVIGIFDILGTMGSGWLSDRFDSRWLLFWYYGLRGLSLMFLPVAYNFGFYGLMLFVVFYGLDWVATVPPTVRLTADIFGKANVSTVFAWIFASHQLGSAAAAYGAGLLRTWLGDYQASFIIAGLFGLVAAVMALGIGRDTHRDPLPALQPELPATPAG
ncbi:MAG TPA: MFS transporter [Anaerolineae bacterium]|nr:MFS transporter [Anaerolineae bacterium]